MLGPFDPREFSTYGSDDHLALLMTKRLAGEWRFAHGSGLWFRRVGGRWLPGVDEEVKAVAAQSIAAILDDLPVLAAELQAPTKIPSILQFVVADRRIAVGGSQP